MDDAWIEMMRLHREYEQRRYEEMRKRERRNQFNGIRSGAAIALSSGIGQGLYGGQQIKCFYDDIVEQEHIDPVCECGVEAAESSEPHSKWCPKSE